jgi:D-alanyl-D-alanine carboxypeptidase
MNFFALCLIAVTAVAPVQSQYRRTPYVGAVAVDCADGRVLLSDNAARACYPASCTKLMTAYLVLEEVKNGSISLSDRIGQTRESLAEKPSISGLRAGDTVTVDEALKILMVKSANDIAVMLAQHVSDRLSGSKNLSGAGKVANFVGLMNKTASAMGMKDTLFTTPNGYPPPIGSKRGFDRSTARDLSVLGRRVLIDHPEILRYTSVGNLTVKSGGGSVLCYTSHNNLMVGNRKRGIAKMREVDGLKTGYHDAGGSSIVLTGKRNGKRALVVVVGSSSAKDRDDAAGRMLSDALGALDW